MILLQSPVLDHRPCQAVPCFLWHVQGCLIVSRFVRSSHVDISDHFGLRPPCQAILNGFLVDSVKWSTWRMNSLIFDLLLNAILVNSLIFLFVFQADFLSSVKNFLPVCGLACWFWSCFRCWLLYWTFFLRFGLLRLDFQLLFAVRLGFSLF